MSAGSIVVGGGTGLTHEALPEDALRHIYLQVLRRVRTLFKAMAIFQCSVRLRSALATFVDELTLSAPVWASGGMLMLPCARVRRDIVPFLAPFGWAAQLRGLRVLELVGLSWSGAARLLTLLPAWAQLEQLELRFAYDPEAMGSVAEPFQEFADDLASVLHMGVLPQLRYLWLGNVTCTHCFGQRSSEEGSAALDDRALLEELRPTAALWWMAERASHVRCSKLHQFQYEIDHGADLHAEVGTFSIVSWMHARLGLQRHSRAGHRAVHELLRTHGAVGGQVQPWDQSWWTTPTLAGVLADAGIERVAEDFTSDDESQHNDELESEQEGPNWAAQMAQALLAENAYHGEEEGEGEDRSDAYDAHEHQSDEEDEGQSSVASD